MNLQEASEAFILAKQIAGLSPNTIRNYRLALRRLAASLGEKPIDAIGLMEVREFVHRLQTNAPQSSNRIPKTEKPLGPKSIKNVVACLSSFWGWAVDEGLSEENIIRKVKAPQPKPPTIKPFTQSEILAILATARKARKEEVRLRDVAIILLLLDTGVRNSELCGLSLANVELQMRSARVAGKGRRDSGTGKERVVHFSASTARAIQRYTLYRGGLRPESFLFVTSSGKRLNRYHLTQRIRRLGKRAGIDECYPHKFRHTFSIQFLGNGGNIYALQKLLGHTSLDMVKRYLAIAQSDLERAHEVASPVQRWGL